MITGSDFPSARKALLGCFLLFVLGCEDSKPVATGGDRKPWAEIQARNDAMNAAEKNKQLEALMNFLTPDFTCVGTHGQTISREEIKAQWAENFKEQDGAFEKSTKVKSLAFAGETVVVIVHNEVSFPFFGREMNGHTLGPENAKHSAVVLEDERQLWIRTTTGWKMRRWEDLVGQVLVDGKVLESWQHE